jgi:lipopolysaccharide export system permease protein
MSVLVSVLVAYALLARRSEAVAWWASGQSTYRLAAPALVFSVLVGLCHWTVQEGLLPYANRRQDALRAQIRGGEPRAETAAGRQWLVSADARRIYSYQFEEGGANAALNLPAVYEFDREGVHVERVTVGERGAWEGGQNDLALKNALTLGAVRREGSGGGEWEVSKGDTHLAVEPPDVFKPVLKKPSEMNTRELSAYLKHLRGRGDASRAPLAVALERKKADPLSPLVMALVGIPLAFAFGRRSSIAALCAAVAVGLLYWAAIGGFQQLGNMGVLPPSVAAWVPAVVCASIGIYLLSRSRT